MKTFKMRKEKLTRAAFLLNGFLFLMGGVDLVQNEKIVFAAIQLIASLLNFGVLAGFKNEKIKKNLNTLILLMNVVVSLSVGIDYHLSGKSFIQYAWYLAALVSIIALVVQLRKSQP